MKKKRRCDWQRARAANDRYVTGPHVKNALSLWLEYYGKAWARCLQCCSVLHFWEAFRLSWHLDSSAYYSVCLAPSATVAKLAPGAIINEPYYYDMQSANFKKFAYMQDVLRNVTELITQFMCSFWGHNKGVFYAYAYTIYIYNRALYTYINVRTYVHTHWKPLHPLCSWSGYWPERFGFT